MQDIRSILVGLELDADGAAISPGSRKAAEQALAVAAAGGARVTFLHSVHAPAYFDAQGREMPVTAERPGDEALAALERCADEARAAGVDAALALTSARPWLEATRRASAGEADLVVFGKRNELDTDGRKLGSVAVKLVRSCPEPVWLVRPEHDLVHRLILAASDLGAVADRACRYGCWLARGRECELHVVHAWQTPHELVERRESLGEQAYAARQDELRARAGEHIEESTRGACDQDQKIEIHFGRGDPASVIREAVAHLDPDLLIMGAISRPDPHGALIGSTMERLLDRVDCSILALKPEGFVSPVREG